MYFACGTNVITQGPEAMVVGRKGGPQNTGIYECYFIWQIKNLRDHKFELAQCLQAPQIKG